MDAAPVIVVMHSFERRSWAWRLGRPIDIAYAQLDQNVTISPIFANVDRLLRVCVVCQAGGFCGGAAITDFSHSRTKQGWRRRWLVGTVCCCVRAAGIGERQILSRYPRKAIQRTGMTSSSSPLRCRSYLSARCLLILNILLVRATQPGKTAHSELAALRELSRCIDNPFSATCLYVNPQCWVDDGKRWWGTRW